MRVVIIRVQCHLQRTQTSISLGGIGRVGGWGGGVVGCSGKSADGALILLPKPPIYITCTIHTPAIIEQLFSTSQLNLPIGS